MHLEIYIRGWVSCVLPRRSCKTSRTWPHCGRSGFTHCKKKFPVQSYNSFLDQRSQKVVRMISQRGWTLTRHTGVATTPEARTTRNEDSLYVQSSCTDLFLQSVSQSVRQWILFACRVARTARCSPNFWEHTNGMSELPFLEFRSGWSFQPLSSFEYPCTSTTEGSCVFFRILLKLPPFCPSGFVAL